MEGKKRKRDEEQSPTVVTFSAPHNRTFDRVLRDQSFSQVKELVRKKLGLSKDDRFTFVQLREGREIDLDDEDDYEAFRVSFRTTPSPQVSIRIDDGSDRGRLDSAPSKPQMSFVSQPVAGPSTVTLDNTPRVEQDAVAEPPRKKKKSSSIPPTDRAPSVAESLANDDSAKKRKKSKSRVPSISPVANPSSNAPSSLGPSSTPRIQSADPPIPESASPSDARPLQTSSSEAPHAAKTEKKRTANVEDTPLTLVTTPKAPPAPSKSKKHSTVPSEPVEEPRPKKVKKKVKEVVNEQSDPIDNSAPTTPASLPPQSTERRTTKERKSKKDVNSSTAQNAADPTVSAPVDPPAAEKSGKSKKKKTVAAEDPPAVSSVAQPVTDGPAQSAQAAEPPKKKKSKASSSAETAPVPSAGDVQKGSTAGKGSAATSRAKSSAETQPVPKKSKAASKEKTKAVILDDVDIMAAVTAVLTNLSAAPQPEAAPSPSTVQSEILTQPSKASSKSAKAPSAKLKKSRLSQSWGPADLTEDADLASSSLIPSIPLEETSVSAVLSKPRVASVRRPPRPAIATESPSVQPIPPAAPEKPASLSSVSRAASPERPLSAIPAGSEISELVVQGQGEGSSGESEDSEDDSVEKAAEAPANPPLSRSLSRLATSGPNSATLSEVDVEALLRGPLPNKSILSFLPSSSSSEADDKSESEALASEEEEREERAYRRMSKRFETRGSSSDEESAEDEPVVAEQAYAPASPGANDDDSMDGSAPVESPAPVAAEATKNTSPDPPPSIDLNSDDEQQVPSEQALVKKIYGDSESAATPEPHGSKETLDGSSSRADAEEVEDIVPTSDPVETSEGHDQSSAPNSPPAGEPEEQSLSRQPSEEVPYPMEVDATEEGAQGADGAINDAELEVEGSKEEGSPSHAATTPDVQMDVDPEAGPPKNINVDSRSSSTPYEDPADPIESAEDLPIVMDMASQDPIEFDPPALGDGEHTSPPMSTPQRGVARRMKGRNGSAPVSDTLPVLSSQPRQTRQTRSTRGSSKANSTEDKTDDNVPPSTPPEAGKEDEPSATAAPRRSARQASVAPPEPPAAAPKRRGRPPATAEEKARKAAEKEAEKQRKAAEKEAEKLRKQEEKRKKDEEKALKKAAVKSKKTPAKKALAAADDEAISAALSTRSNQPETITASQVVVSQDAPSVVKWTALADTSQTQEADQSSMIDELRSSSPQLPPDIPVSTRISVRNQEPVDVSMHQDNDAEREDGVEEGEEEGDEEEGDEEGDEDEDEDDESPTVKVNGKDRPLFIPSDSQYPPPDVLHPSSSQPSQPSQPQSQPSQPQPQSQSPQKPKMRPVTSWANQSKFRRLSDMSSQDMFSPVRSLPVPLRRQSVQQTAEERRASLYGNVEDSDSDDSDSDDEANVSHIPKHRLAGVHKKEMFVD